MRWALISAVNDVRTLNACLLKSPNVASADEVILQEGFLSAATAYNEAMERAESDLLVFAHQDVYLPDGWITVLENVERRLAEKDPNWGTLGVYGVTNSGKGIGYLYCTAAAQTIGAPFADPVEVRSLDEVVIIMRRAADLRFDDKLPGFHMYGTDICLEALRRGMKSYVTSAFCIHNANGRRLLPIQFWRCYFFMMKKWRTELPIVTPCISITRWGWPVARWNCVRAINCLTGRDAPPGRRVPNPELLCSAMADARKC